MKNIDEPIFTEKQAEAFWEGYRLNPFEGTLEEKTCYAAVFLGIMEWLWFTPNGLAYLLKTQETSRLDPRIPEISYPLFSMVFSASPMSGKLDAKLAMEEKFSSELREGVRQETVKFREYVLRRAEIMTGQHYPVAWEHKDDGDYKPFWTDPASKPFWELIEEMKNER